MKVALNAQTVEGFVQSFLIDRFSERRPIAPCHRKWWKLLCSTHPQVAFAAPRGHGKSTASNHAYGLAATLFERHPFQIKVSKTYELACEKLKQAKEELLANEKIRKVFKLKRFIVERENDIIVEMSDGYTFRMIALGMNQAIRGFTWGTMRPTLINCDDMESDEEVLNPERREASMNWILKTLLPMGGETTQIRIYGTILHQDSALQNFIDDPEWLSSIDQACDADITPESILWPEKFTKERLEKIRRTYVSRGNLVGFNMEYRNIALDTTSGFFRPEDFVAMNDGDLSQIDNRKMTFYVGGDLAISKEDHRDYTVFFVGGIDAEGTLHIVDERRGRWDGNEIIDEMFALDAAWAPQEWFIESGAIKKALSAALEIRMRERLRTEGIGYLNIAPDLVPTKDKATRAMPLQARMRGRGVRFHKQAQWYPDMEMEMIQFSKAGSRGSHDDRVDALAWMVTGLQRMQVPATADEEEEWDYRFARKQAQLNHNGRSRIGGY